ncbi:MAG TPA: hypothetical protein VMT52_05965 [Planctomycetota bacterium]|nr:hypothetical protein [Planctomycetota bacterium]
MTRVSWLAAATMLGVSCHYDDDDCHTHHYSSGVSIRHCHDDDFLDDDDFDDDDFDDDIFHLNVAPAELAVLVTDAPRAGLRAMHVTITEVALLSREVKPQVVFASGTGRRLELLSLRGEPGTRLYEVLAGRTGLAPAVFDSVRIRFSSPSLILAAGEAVGPSAIDCPSGCAVDVALPEPLLLGPSELAFLVIDVLVEPSLSAPDASAAAPRWTFRPAVQVQAFREDAADAIVTPLEVAGIVLEVDLPGERLRLEVDGEAGVLDIGAGLEAEIFAEDLERIPLESVERGSRINVRGTLNVEGSLAARSAFLGPTYRRRGILREVRSTGGGLRLALEDEEARSRFEVSASPETLVSLRRTRELALGAARPGQLAVITALPSAAGLPPTAVRIDLEPVRSVEIVPLDSVPEAPPALPTAAAGR